MSEEVKCPKCSSTNISVYHSTAGYFTKLSCQDCKYIGDIDIYKEPMSEEIKNCPFCGSKPRIIMYKENENLFKYFSDRYAVQCEWTGEEKGCGAEGSHQKTKEMAIEYWDHRQLEELDVNVLSNFIRVYDGNHDKGAGEIAEAICAKFGRRKVDVKSLLKKIEDYLETRMDDGTSLFFKDNISESSAIDGIRTIIKEIEK